MTGSLSRGDTISRRIGGRAMTKERGAQSGLLRGAFGMTTSRKPRPTFESRRYTRQPASASRRGQGWPVGFSPILALLLVASLVQTPTATAASPVVAAWGNNSSGQLGDGTTTNRSTPVQVSGLTGVTAIAAGSEHSLGLVADGTVRAWGNNSVGQLGDNATAGTNQTTPVQVVTATAVLTDVTVVAAGLAHSMAVDTSTSLWAWGRNLDGELGLDDSSGLAYPRAEEVMGQVTAIADGGLGAHSLAVMEDGSLLAWGANLSGQVGDGTTTNRIAPVSVSGDLSPAEVAAGSQHSLALLDDGSVWAWGNNQFGQLGDGTTTNRTTPVQAFAGVPRVAAIAAGGVHNLLLLGDGTVLAWGANGSGQLGDGTTTDRHAPVQVVGLSGVIGIAAGFEHSLALLDDGTVWAWGANAAGQLGDGTTTSQNTPVQVSNLTGVTAIAAGASHSLAVGDVTTTSAGSLTATVTVAAPTEACLLLTASTLDFGTLDFGASATSPAYDLVSCSTEAQDLFAHASDATSEASLWTLTAPPRAEDQFSVDAATLEAAREWLTSDALPMGIIEAEATAPGQNHVLEMPPAGSSGAGETMSFDIIWTAVLSSP